MGEIDEDNMIKSKDVIGLFFCPEGGGEEGGREGPRTRTRGRARGRCGRSQEEEEEGRQVKLLSTSTLPSSRGYLRTTCHQEEGDSAFWSPQRKYISKKNYRIVPERWINIFCIRMSVFPLPSVWTSGAPLCCTRRRNVL